MKKSLCLFAFSFCIFFAGRSHAQESFRWTELNSFHETAMSSFHAAEANKLQPVRDSAASILKKAEQWQNAQIPSNYNAAVLKPLLQNLVDQCKAIKDAVSAKKPDAFLRPLVMKAHDSFHLILSKTR